MVYPPNAIVSNGDAVEYLHDQAKNISDFIVNDPDGYGALAVDGNRIALVLFGYAMKRGLTSSLADVVASMEEAFNHVANVATRSVASKKPTWRHALSEGFSVVVLYDHFDESLKEVPVVWGPKDYVSAMELAYEMGGTEEVQRKSYEISAFY